MAPLTRQAGISLMVSLIMLLVVTTLLILGFKLSQSSLQISGNRQQRAETLSAAQSVLAQTVSSTSFTATPNVASAPTVPAGYPNISVTVTPSCVSSQPIPVSQLDFSNPNDAGCLVGAGQQMGVVGASSTGSLCANQLWDLDAVATDSASGAASEVHQGVSMRVASTTQCPD